MQRFTELKVWQKAHVLVLEVYRLTKAFPADERYGLTSQLRRAAASVPGNIAEGCKRRSAADYARFLNMSESSLSETEYFLLLSRDLGYLAVADFDRLQPGIDEIQRMLDGLHKVVTS